MFITVDIKKKILQGISTFKNIPICKHFDIKKYKTLMENSY